MTNDLHFPFHKEILRHARLPDRQAQDDGHYGNYVTVLMGLA